MDFMGLFSLHNKIHPTAVPFPSLRHSRSSPHFLTSTPVLGLLPQPPPPTPFGFRSGVEDRSEARAEEGHGETGTGPRTFRRDNNSLEWSILV